MDKRTKEIETPTERDPTGAPKKVSSSSTSFRCSSRRDSYISLFPSSTLENKREKKEKKKPFGWFFFLLLCHLRLQ